MFNFSFNFSCPAFVLDCFYLRTSVAFFIKIIAIVTVIVKYPYKN